MNLRPKYTINDIADYFGLRLEFRDDLPANNGGYLDPDDEPQYIAVNRNLPHCEQAFTIAHELGHYVNHHNRSRRRYFPGLLDREYQSQRVANLTYRTRRALYFICTKEWEADLYAFCLLFGIGAVDDLKAYIERHPEKMGLFFLASVTCFVKAIPRIVRALLLKFFKRFSLHKAQATGSSRNQPES